MLHRRLHFFFGGSCRDYRVFAKNSLDTIEVADLLHLLRKRLFLLKFLRLLHFLGRQLLWVVVVVLHMLYLFVEVGPFAHLADLRGSRVKVLGLGYNGAVGVAVVLLYFHAFVHVLVGRNVWFVFDNLCRLKDNIVAGLLVSIVNLLSLHVACLRDVGVIDRDVARFGEETRVEVALFYFLRREVARAGDNVPIGVSPGYKITVRICLQGLSAY